VAQELRHLKTIDCAFPTLPYNPAAVSTEPIQNERPLSSTAKAVLVCSAAATIGLCYAFSIVSILILVVALGVELTLFVGAARFGATAVITPFIRRHASLLATFVRSLWLRQSPEYRLKLEERDAPRLFIILHQLAQRFGVAIPKEVAIEMSANAWVHLKGYGGNGKTVLAIGYDLLAGLSEGEVQAVLGHEMGHAKFVRRGIKRWLDAGVRRVAIVNSYLIGKVDAARSARKTFRLAEMFLWCSDPLTRTAARLLAKCSRQDEFEADRVSAELFGSASLRSALTRLHLLGEKLSRLPWTERLAHLELEGSFSRWLAGELAFSSSGQTLELTSRAHDPYSTHPSLPDRLAALPPDDARMPNPAPAIGLLSEPDRVAEKLIAEIQRVLATQEAKDTESLARWSRKTHRASGLRIQQLFSLLMIVIGLVGGPLMWMDGSRISAALLTSIVIAAGVYSWRLSRYRETVRLPVPPFGVLLKSWSAPPVENIGDQEKQFEAEMLSKISSKSKKEQKIAILLEEGCAALRGGEYLRAHVASRLAIKLNNKCVDAALIYTTAAAGLRLWNQVNPNLEFVRKRTGLSTPSTKWGAAWVFSLAADWGRAEALLWECLKIQPTSATFLMLLSLAQVQRGKLQSAIINARKANALHPNDKEQARMLIGWLLDAGRLAEAQQALAKIERSANSDPEIAMLIVRLRLLRREFSSAIEAANLLHSADNNPPWLIRLGNMFETARLDQDAARFFEAALATAHYPEALLGLSRLASERNDKDKVRQYLLQALDLEKEVGAGGRTAVDLFQPIVAQLRLLEEPQENCQAWIGTFPADADPSPLAGRALMLYAPNQNRAMQYIDEILTAMQPNGKRTPAVQLQWTQAPKHQQPVSPVHEGIQAVL
jgi:Zn-dependent protease with chaperone function/tetratricopeptide (TPR) repeat protein